MRPLIALVLPVFLACSPRSTSSSDAGAAASAAPSAAASASLCLSTGTLAPRSACRDAVRAELHDNDAQFGSGSEIEEIVPLKADPCVRQAVGYVTSHGRRQQFTCRYDLRTKTPVVTF